MNFQSDPLYIGPKFEMFFINTTDHMVRDRQVQEQQMTGLTDPGKDL